MQRLLETMLSKCSTVVDVSHQKLNNNVKFVSRLQKPGSGGCLGRLSNGAHKLLVRTGIIQLDGLDLTGEAGCWPEVFQPSHKLDHSANESERDLSAEAVVETVTKWLHRSALDVLASAIGPKLL